MRRSANGPRRRALCADHDHPRVRPLRRSGRRAAQAARARRRRRSRVPAPARSRGRRQRALHAARAPRRRAADFHTFSGLLELCVQTATCSHRAHATRSTAPGQRDVVLRPLARKPFVLRRPDRQERGARPAALPALDRGRRRRRRAGRHRLDRSRRSKSPRRRSASRCTCRPTPARRARTSTATGSCGTSARRATCSSTRSTAAAPTGCCGWTPTTSC